MSPMPRGFYDSVGSSSPHMSEPVKAGSIPTGVRSLSYLVFTITSSMKIKVLLASAYVAATQAPGYRWVISG